MCVHVLKFICVEFGPGIYVVNYMASFMLYVVDYVPHELYLIITCFMIRT